MSRDTATEMLLMLLRGQPIADITSNAWRAIASLASKHRLAPLVFSRLKTLGIADQVPTDVLQGLRSQYLDTARRNARMYHVLAVLLKRFQSEDIPCIPLKGAYLAEQIYGNIALRPMLDVDILVKDYDLARVERIIHELGFKGPREVDELPEEREHHSYSHAEFGLEIEVHWNLINASNYGIQVDIDSLWDRSRAALVAGIPVREMSPEDLVLHLCAHNAKDFFSRPKLGAIHDLAETVRVFRSTIDWECLRRRAYEWGAERCVYLNLWMAKELLNAPVPNEVMGALTPRDVDPQYVCVAVRHLFLSEEANEEAWPPSRDFARFWTAKGLASKLSLVWRPLFPSRAVMARIYATRPDSPRILLYYPVRLWDLVKHYSQVIRRLQRGEHEVRIRVEHHAEVKALNAWVFPGRS